MIDLTKMDRQEVGKLFDYSILPKQLMEEEIRRGCREAVAYNCAAFYSASPYWTPVVKEELVGTDATRRQASADAQDSVERSAPTNLTRTHHCPAAGGCKRRAFL